ncbi:hypothetical protein [Micromonospora halophytica]|uniref:Lipoprotein n=1 Tax=Micromonospora halophytica TaxID=47864 RepID=A0A1C5ISX7_9ACTN|nr:hypothetical protein [Micromonospora halophytica]SCG61415.1 hypothetical protein GA0070560_11639 [Micromonospora halophytica]
MAKRRPSGAGRPAALFSTLVTAGVVVLALGCAPVGGERTATPPAAAPRTLTLPETVLGMPRSTSPELIRFSRSPLDRLRAEVTDPTSTVDGAYAWRRRNEDAVVVTGVSGTVTDPQGALTRVLSPYPVKTFRTVEYGRFAGEARCGRGRTEDRGYLTVCGWADPQTAGVVAFVSSRKQLELNTEFYGIRDTLDGTAG